MYRISLVVSVCFAVVVALLVPNAWAGVNGWDHVGNGGTAGTASLNGNVTSLYANGTDLYVGGQFTDAGGVSSADHFAKWDGSQWKGFAPLNGAVNAATIAGGKPVRGRDIH